jgi:hypothetical protein
MSSAYYPKDDQVARRSVEVQKLSIPFFITANATAASKSISCDEPSLLFLDVQGINQCTLAAGAFDSSAEASSITYQTLTSGDASGLISVLVRTNEPNALVKVMSCKLVNRAGGTSSNGTWLGAQSTGSSPGFIVASIAGSTVGNKIVADFATGINLSTTNADLCLEVEYIAAQ